MYVDNFFFILGNTASENTLLDYAKNYNVKTLLLYDMHKINVKYNLTNTQTNRVLADFISNAKINYGILKIGVTGENIPFFKNVVNVYNNSRTNEFEKFDVYNLEFEFWRDEVVVSGSKHCENYLIPNGLSCDNDGAFQFFISVLKEMRTLASNNSHNISTEAYVGKITENQAKTIGENLDLLRIHAYVKDPKLAFSYIEERLLSYINNKPNADVSVIFSSENNYMQDWLKSNSISEAEDIFTTDWKNASSTWKNSVNFKGFTYFNYTENLNLVLSKGRN